MTGMMFGKMSCICLKRTLALLKMQLIVTSPSDDDDDDDDDDDEEEEEEEEDAMSISKLRIVRKSGKGKGRGGRRPKGGSIFHLEQQQHELDAFQPKPGDPTQDQLWPEE